MHDVLHFTKGYPIPVRTFFRELETDAERAYPDNQKFAEIVIDFFQQTEQSRMHKSMEVRKATVNKYTWDNAAQVWEKYIDSYKATGLQGQWDTPPNLLNIPNVIDNNIKSHQDFVYWIFRNLNMPERAYQYEGKQMLRNLTFGAQMGQGVLEPINSQQIFDTFKQRMTNINQTELVRSGNTTVSPDPFIVAAHQVLKEQQK